jgi:hypothetical protein
MKSTFPLESAKLFEVFVHSNNRINNYKKLIEQALVASRQSQIYFYLTILSALSYLNCGLSTHQSRYLKT